MTSCGSLLWSSIITVLPFHSIVLTIYLLLLYVTRKTVEKTKRTVSTATVTTVAQEIALYPREFTNSPMILGLLISIITKTRTNGSIRPLITADSTIRNTRGAFGISTTTAPATIIMV